MALPTVEQRRASPLTALFIGSSFAVAATAGFGLGTWLLLRAATGTGLGPDWPALVQLHGHAQLLGFAGLLVIGIACRVLPRFRGADEPRAREVLAVFALVATGLLARSAQAWPDSPARALLLSASGTAELAGMLLYARLALRTLASGASDHRADELFLGMGAAFGVVGAMWQLVALAPAVAGARTVDPSADGAAIAVLLLGFVAAHVVGVSLRVAPAFIGAAPAPGGMVTIAAGGWAAGVTLTALGGPLGPAVLLATAAVLVRAIPFGRGAAVRPVPPHARAVRLAFRGAYAWLLVGLALLTLGAAGAPAAVSTAGRHAVALGFLTQIVFGVGSRLIPALTGGNALALPAVRGAILTVNVAAALRVVGEIAGPSTLPAAALLGLSGPLALAALLVFAGAAARSVRSAFAT